MHIGNRITWLLSLFAGDFIIKTCTKEKPRMSCFTSVALDEI
jgi:hypothetical protein